MFTIKQNFQNYIKNSKNHHILIRLGLIERVFPKLFTYTNQTCGTSLGWEKYSITIYKSYGNKNSKFYNYLNALLNAKWIIKIGRYFSDVSNASM